MYKSNNTFEFPCNNWIFSWNLIINDDSYRYIISSAMNASLFALKSNKIDRLMNPDTQTVNEHFDAIYENVLLFLDMFSLCFANFHMFFGGFHLNRLKMVFVKTIRKMNQSENHTTYLENIGKLKHVIRKKLEKWIILFKKKNWNQRKFDYPYTNPVEVVQSNKSKIIRMHSLKMGKTFIFHGCMKRTVYRKSNDLVILSSFAHKKAGLLCIEMEVLIEKVNSYMKENENSL